LGGPNGHPLPVVQPCLGDLIEHVTPYTLSPTNLIVRRSTLKVGGTRPRRRRTPRLEEGVEAFTKTTSTRKIVQVVVFVNGAYAPSALDARVCFGLVASPSRVDRLSGRKCHSKKTITRKFEILSLRACRAGSLSFLSRDGGEIRGHLHAAQGQTGEAHAPQLSHQLFRRQPIVANWSTIARASRCKA